MVLHRLLNGLVKSIYLHSTKQIIFQRRTEPEIFLCSLGKVFVITFLENAVFRPLLTSAYIRQHTGATMQFEIMLSLLSQSSFCVIDFWIAFSHLPKTYRIERDIDDFTVAQITHLNATNVQLPLDTRSAVCLAKRVTYYLVSLFTAERNSSEFHDIQSKEFSF